MSLSLKQKLSNISSELQSQVDTLSTETSEAVAFFHNITSANADIAALESTVSTNAGGISTLQTTTAGQTSDIATITSDVATNAQSIIDLNSGFTSQLNALGDAKQDNLVASSVINVKNITLNDHLTAGVRTLDFATIVAIEANLTGLASDGASEVARAEGIESNIAASVLTEATRAQTIELGLQSALDAEVIARAGADSTLQLNIDTAISTAAADDATEAGLRVVGDNKMCFCSMMEFEGVLVAAEYPFASGYGSPSGPGFGLPVPFGYKLVGYSVICVSTDASPAVSLQLEHYDFGSATPVVIDSPALDSTKYVNVKALVDVAHLAGNVCVKVVSKSGVVDVDAKYRLALYLQSQEELA